MKVWYNLPPVNYYEIADTMSEVWPAKDYDRDMNIAILKHHKDIMRPMFDWMEEMGMPQKCWPTMNYQRRYDTDQLHSNVSFDLPDEHAVMFILKFGKGHDYSFRSMPKQCV